MIRVFFYKLFILSLCLFFLVSFQKLPIQGHAKYGNQIHHRKKKKWIIFIVPMLGMFLVFNQ